MSDTPRTDALIEGCHRAMYPEATGTIPLLPMEKRLAHFARQLEREGAAMRHALDCILTRIYDEEFIPQEYVEMAREAMR
jgi:hypothetical protein